MKQMYWIAITLTVGLLAIFIAYNLKSFVSYISVIYANIESIIAIVLSAALTAYFTYSLTEKGRRRKQHFSDIKQLVLSPILNNLTEAGSAFVFVEGSALRSVPEILGYPPDYYIWFLQKFGIANGIPSYLFTDIKNHYSSLFDSISKTELSIQTDGPKFLKLQLETQKSAEVAADSIVNTKKLGDNKIFQKQWKETITSTIMFLIIKKPEDQWYNYKAQLIQQKVLEDVEKAAKTIENEVTTKEMIKIMNELTDKISKTSLSIEKVFYTQSLLGECSFC